MDMLVENTWQLLVGCFFQVGLWETYCSLFVWSRRDRHRSASRPDVVQCLSMYLAAVIVAYHFEVVLGMRSDSHVQCVWFTET